MCVFLYNIDMYIYIYNINIQKSYIYLYYTKCLETLEGQLVKYLSLYLSACFVHPFIRLSIYLCIQNKYSVR